MSEAFTDLEIRIFSCQDKGYPVEITLGGQQEFPRGFMAGDILPWVSSSDAVADGRQLFAALFADAQLRSAWDEARGRAPQRRLRLRIDPGAAELHALPWELLCDANTMFSARADVPFSRYLPVALPWSGTASEPIRVLVVIANPADLDAYHLAPVDVPAERASLEQALGALSPAEVRVDFLPSPVTLKCLERKLREGYHILHYLGHGAFDRSRQRTALYMQDDAGNTQVVTDDALIGMLSRQHARPSLVFLAACQSAMRATSDAFLGLGPKLISAGVPAVVAMQDVLSFSAARALSAVFYNRLLAHGVVDLAMNEARSALVTGGHPDAAVPVLFMRLKSGQLWGAEADARGLVLGAQPATFWEGLISNLSYGECLPIIGPHVHGRWLPPMAGIASRWSDRHAYPFLTKQNIARVAQYLVSYHGEVFPRRELLRVLKEEFVERLPEALRPEGRYERRSLTDLVRAVGWSALAEADPNEVHHVLASLDLPLYITTNPDSFMVEALAAQGKTPVREFCHWDAHLDRLPSALTGTEIYDPSPDRPLVYHLFGSDEVPRSLLLTEDDYLRFLVRVTAERDRIPNLIREALSSSSLIFMGYSLYDWEFRVLLHGLVANLDQRLGFKHIAVQLAFEGAESTEAESARDFLERYFHDTDINVFWGTSAQFVAELREYWEARR